jgi:hypothetical protein
MFLPSVFAAARPLLHARRPPTAGGSMQSSIQVLQSAQLARMRASPLAKAQAAAPGSPVYLEGLRQRNAVLDWLFYDVGVVSHEEAVSLSPWLAAEGTVLFVPPSGAGTLKVCASIDEFVAAHGSRVRALAVAGVGSSALGAAAFARNVADALHEPVAAVVSGYGLADLAAEALGGFFLFGAANAWRHQFEWLDRLRESAAVADPGTGGAGAAKQSAMQLSKDTRTVQALLSHEALKMKLLIGHSKGNLVVSEALFNMKAEDPAHLKRLGKQVLVVTVSAKIAMPPDFERIVDIIGQVDGFGALNSRWDLGTEVTVPLAWHHTNTQLPLHLPVTKTLGKLPEIGQL